MNNRRNNLLSKPQITKLQYDEVENSFYAFDTDESGFLDKHELSAALKALGFELRKSEIEAIISENDINQVGGINIKTFHKIADVLVSNRDPISDIKKSFLRFSSDGTSQLIDFKCLKKIAKENNILITDDKINEMIKEFDEDGDGFINEEEFINIFAPKPLQ